MKVITLRLTNEQHAHAKKMAKKAGVAIEQYIKNLIENDGGTVNIPLAKQSCYERYLKGVYDPRD